MSFTNVQIDPEALPRFAEVEFQEPDAAYARVVLGIALVFQIPAFLIWNVFLIAFLVPEAGLPWPIAGLLFVTVLLLFVFAGWFAYTSARVKRYALREHDVIVQSGVFWRKETVQPIRRIQHIEQHQGPIDKRYGLYELKLYSAGTARFTFRIPGLDAEAASSIRRFILNRQEDGWDAAQAPAIPGAETPPDRDE